MNKQKIEAKIRELVPSLQELSFGCEVVWKYKHQIGGVRSKGGLCRFTRGKKAVVMQDDMVSGILIRIEKNYSLRHVNPSTLRIIGHPIHLEHVLMAIRQTGVYIAMGANGLFMDSSIPLPGQSVWYQTDKPFNEQEYALYDLLANIIGSK